MFWLPSVDHHQGQLAVEQELHSAMCKIHLSCFQMIFFLSFMEKVNNSQKFSKAKEDSIEPQEGIWNLLGFVGSHQPLPWSSYLEFLEERMFQYPIS